MNLPALLDRMRPYFDPANGGLDRFSFPVPRTSDQQKYARRITIPRNNRFGPSLKKVQEVRLINSTARAAT